MEENRELNYEEFENLWVYSEGYIDRINDKEE